MPNAPQPTRRDVLRYSAAAVFLPTLISKTLLGQASPSNTLRVAAIGVGRMGRGDIFSILDRGLDDSVAARVVAVCDVDSNRADRAKADIQKRYAERLPNGAKANIDTYSNFRELLERDDIDAVTISTPDHQHAICAALAARAGKHVYLQKPMTYSIAEGRALVTAVRESGVVLQVGSQQRSNDRFRKACELVRNGALGGLKRVHVFLPPDHGQAATATGEAPKNLDYNAWSGGTEPVPYAELGVHPQEGFSRPGWLQRRRYCLGMITGWGAHMNDIAQWGHGGDVDSGPVRFEATAEYPKRGLFNVHTTFRAECSWADGVKLIQETGDAGVRFEGERGSIWVSRSTISADPAELLDTELGEDAERLYVSRDHYRNFLECARSGEEPIAPVEVGHRSNTVCIATDIAMQLGRPLTWDPKTELFTDDDEANSRLDYKHRKGWEL